MATKYMNWSLLNNNNPILLGVLQEWQELLDSQSSEAEYHSFIKRHANLFLSNSLESFFSISKLKLGTSLELDFAVPHEGYSMGLQWELVEIEKPQDAPYNKDGTPSAALTRATQQIRDWKDWLQNSRHETQKLFSVWQVRTQKQPNFKFKIIIGTRENSEKWIDKRNQYAEENNEEIRSFDHLTDRLKLKPFFEKVMLLNAMWDKENPALCSKLANPFAQSFTDSEWKALLREPNLSGAHFTSKAAEIITSRWSVNEDLLLKFSDFCKK